MRKRDTLEPQSRTFKLSERFDKTIDLCSVEMRKQKAFIREFMDLTGKLQDLSRTSMQDATGAGECTTRFVQTDPICFGDRPIQKEASEVEAGVATRPPKVTPMIERGRQIPHCCRIHMKSFPKKPRVMMFAVAMRFVYRLYFYKVSVDEVRKEEGLQPQNIGELLAQYLYNKYGLRKIADHKIAEVVKTCQHFHDRYRLQLLGRFLGCYNIGQRQPELSTECLTFLINTLRALRDIREINPEVLENDEDLNLEITRSKAIVILRHQFAYAHPKFVTAAVTEVESLPHPKGGRLDKISLDSFVRIVIERWIAEDTRWRERLRLVYNRNCIYFKQCFGNTICVSRKDAFEDETGTGDLQEEEDDEGGEGGRGEWKSQEARTPKLKEGIFMTLRYVFCSFNIR